MIARSLRLRLLIGAAVAIFAALAVAWVLMTWLFERHVERREAAELTRGALVLVAGLELAPGGAPSALQRPADPRFDEPASGAYWQVSTPGGLVRSRSLWDQSLPTPARTETEAWRSRTVAGPFGQTLLIVARGVRPTRAGPLVLVQVARDGAPLRLARREFGRELAAFLALLWLVLSAAAWLQVRLGLTPLDQVRGELRRLQRSPTARLKLAGPREVEPLIAAINALAEAREADLTRARQRAADLAHSLKTPLAALAAQSRLAREAGAVEAADGLDRAIAAVGAALEAELTRARAAAMRGGGKGGHAAPAAVVEQLVGVIERTDAGQRVIFDNEVSAGLRIPVAAEDLTEILGAVIENAARFARRRVRIRDAGAAGVVVEDDGPGIDDGRAEAALIRGGRLDEAGPGHGLGLAIVRDMMAASEGEVELGRSELGGLAISLSWRRSS